MQTTCVIIGITFLISIKDVDCSIGNKTFLFIMGLFLELHFFGVGVDLFFGDLGDFICIDIALAFLMVKPDPFLFPVIVLFVAVILYFVVAGWI